MPDASPDQTLHLPNLVIKNFRGIDELTIPRLGRVTLLAGKNGVGKTTVLDAVRVWATRGQVSVFDDTLHKRGDSFTVVDREGKQHIGTDKYALFTDRRASPEAEISIGPSSDSDVLRIALDKNVKLQSGQPTMYRTDDFSVGGSFALVIHFGGSQIYSAGEGRVAINSPPCNVLGPNGPTDEIVERFWHDAALSPHEDRAVEALNLVVDATVERVAAIDSTVSRGDDFRLSLDPYIFQRRMMARVKGKDYPAPLRTLGDGAMRTFAVALALAASSGGFLLIDEAENGIHHSIQPKFWNMVLQTAQRNNVQVIATTHSWDCVKGFAQAANELEDVEGLLVRIERVPIGLRAITYDESRLKTVARSGIEVR